MALVLGDMAPSIRASSILRVSDLISINTGTPPRNTNAFAVETKVYEGTITSSPGFMSSNRAAISRAAVQEWVSSAFLVPVFSSSQRWQFCVKGPSPAKTPLAYASVIYPGSLPVICGLLKGIFINGVMAN